MKHGFSVDLWMGLGIKATENTVLEEKYTDYDSCMGDLHRLMMTRKKIDGSSY